MISTSIYLYLIYRVAKSKSQRMKEYRANKKSVTWWIIFEEREGACQNMFVPVNELQNKKQEEKRGKKNVCVKIQAKQEAKEKSDILMMMKTL